MTEQQAKDILLESLFHIPETRVDYFNKKCNEEKCDPLTFYNTLFDAFNQIAEFLSHDRQIGSDANGDPVYMKNEIYFPFATGLKNSMTLDDLPKIWQPLQLFFSKIIRERFEKLTPPPGKTIEKITPPPGKTQRSFSWTGSPGQLAALCEGLKDAGYIDRPDLFKGIISGTAIEKEPVSWKGTNRLLAYLFDQITKGSHPLVENRDWQSIIDKNGYFRNRNGKMINRCDLSTALSQLNIAGNGQPAIDDIIKKVRQLRP